MDKFEFLTDRLCHDFPSSKTRGLRSSQLSIPTEQQSFCPDQIAQFTTQKHKAKIPYMTFKPKTQFLKPKPQHQINQLYRSISKQQINQVSSVLKQQNTAINSIVSSGFKDVIKRRDIEDGKESVIMRNDQNNRGKENKKQLSYCISPIKIDDGSVMTPVDKQMFNVLMRLADRMDKLEQKQKDKSKIKQKEKKMKSSKILRNNNKSRNRNKNRKYDRGESRMYSSSSGSPDKYNDDSYESVDKNHYLTNNSKASLKESKFQSHYHSRSRVNIPKTSESKQPQIVINNIIKGKSDLSENKHSRMYDIMDYELRKQENVIRKLELERNQSKNKRLRYHTPDITEFEIEEIQKQKERVRKEEKQKQIKERQRQKQKQEKQEQQKQKQQQEEDEQSRNSNVDTHNNDYFYPKINKKQSFNPSLSCQNTQYPYSNQSSIQADLRANPNLIRHRIRNNIHQQQTPSTIQHNTEYKTQPVQFQLKKPIAFQFPVNTSSNKQNVSLAEAFQKRRHQFHSEKPKQQQRRQKSKEQLAEIRKNMMKRRPTQSSKPQSIEVTIVDSANTSMKQSKREPSKQLLDRLINGTKGPIDKKEMRALTQKNYDQLPEVKQRKEEMKKREELEKRMQQKREYDKNIRKHR